MRNHKGGDDAVQAGLKIREASSTEEAQIVNAARELTWKKPVTFDKKCLPSFPLEVFPKWARDYLEAITRVIQAPSDLAGMYFLGVLAVACQKRFVLKIKSKWLEVLVLWVLVVGESGSKKSPVFKEILAPLKLWNRYMAQEFARIRRAAKRELQDLEAELERQRKARVSPDKLAPLLNKIEELRVPPIPKLYASTGTTEGLLSKLAEHFGRFAIACAESDIFRILLGKYSSGRPTLEPLLDSWNSGDLDSALRTVEDAPIKDAHLSMVLATQPSNAFDMYRQTELGGRGALGRFLTALIPSVPDSWTDEEVSQTIERTYHDGVRRMLPSFDDTVDLYCSADDEKPQTVLRLSAEAQSEFRAFYERIAARRRTGGDLQFLDEWANKLRGQAARIAALLHLADTPGEVNPTVSLSAVQRAIRLMESYLIPHAKAMFGTGATPELEKVWSALQGFDTPEIPRKSLTRAVRPLPAAQLQEALDFLEERNYLRVETRPKPGAKRPPSFIILNPHAPKVLDTFGSPQTAEGTDFEDCFGSSGSNSNGMMPVPPQPEEAKPEPPKKKKKARMSL